MTRLTQLKDADEACRQAAEEMAAAITQALQARGVAHIALAGGGTPRRAYELLAPLIDDWRAVQLWWGDERCVAPDDPDSNHRMGTESLLAGIERRGRSAAPLEHRIYGELGAEEGARLYARELRGAVAADEHEIPRLDLVLLGLGEDGHTASLFPGHPQIDVRGELCLPVHDAPKPPPDRITLSLDVLRAARSALLLVTGSPKAIALAAVLGGPDEAVPASLLASERLHVVCDGDALSTPPDPR